MYVKITASCKGETFFETPCSIVKVILCFCRVAMVALWNRADHYIFALLFLLLSSFFPRLISAVADWMSAILPHTVWP